MSKGKASKDKGGPGASDQGSSGQAPDQGSSEQGSFGQGSSEQGSSEQGSSKITVPSKSKTGGRPKGGKKRDRAAARPAGVSEVGPAAGPDAPGDTAPETPSGQRCYDMPYSALAPRLINPQVGLHNLVTRAGHNAGYTLDVTLLDAPDHRLIRSGVLLAHRVLEGRGEWYLGAAEWHPMLPVERVEPMSQADLPEDYAELVTPFRRRATLGPAAALSCERREFALRDDRGNTLALLRDDKVTVRRGGLTTARYREVMLTPTGPGLTAEQAAHVDRALAGSGATEVPVFPPLVSRLGAPSTGLTDFPHPQGLEPGASFTQFVSHLLLTRLRQVLTADLQVRTDEPQGAVALAGRAGELRGELHGLASVVDAHWLSDLDEELEWVVELAQQELRSQEHPVGRPAGDLKARLRGERYLTLLDRLVTATRAPLVGNAGTLPATEVLSGLVDAAQSAVEQAAGGLDVATPADGWAAATATFDDLLRVTAVAAHLLPERVEQLRHSLGVSRQLLGEAARHDQAARRSLDLAARSSAEEAFVLGRAYEHELEVARGARRAFVKRWAKTRKKLR